jgi:uncharacterized protein YuzE
MRITYDQTVDAAYIYLVEIEPGTSVAEMHVPLDRGEIILDFDKNGYLLGIEILGAESTLKPELLIGADPPKDPGPWIRVQVAAKRAFRVPGP